jgi:DNA-binding transcriptional ArsR family regulator
VSTYQTTLHALADPTRRRILELLRERPGAVGELAGRMPVSRPAVSQHLRVLREAGLVAERREGTRHIFSVEPEGLRDLRRYLDRFWGDALEAFRRAAEAETEKPDMEGEPDAR